MKAIESPDALPLPRGLRRFAIVSIAITVLTYVVAQVRYWLGLRYNPLTEDPFGDLTEYLRTFPYLHTEAFFRPPHPASPVAYPPVGASLYGLCYAFPHPLAFYMAVAAVWIAGSAWLVGRAMTRRGISPRSATGFLAATLIASFPIVGLLERGNIELFLWIFTAAGVTAFFTGNEDLAAILWALAAATKLYPMALFAMFLPRRNWRALGIGIAAFVLSSVLAMVYLGPSIPVAFHGSLQNIFGYQGVRSAQWNLHEIAANHSLYSYSKLLAIICGRSAQSFTKGYYAVGALAFFAFFFGKLVRMPALNQLLAIMLFMTLFPPVTYFYSLVNLYAPFTLLVLLALDAQRGRSPVPHLDFTIFLFVLVFASFVLFTYPRVYVYGGLIQGLVLVVLFLRSASYPLALPAAETPAQA
jgi:hypothetical protein